LSYLADEMARLGWEVVVAYLEDGPNTVSLRNSGVALTKLRSRGNYDPLIVLRLVGVINRFRPAIIQTWLPQMDILGGLAAILTGTPFVASERSSAEAYTHSWRAKLRARVLKRAATIVVNSHGGDRYWADQHPEGTRVLIRNSIPFVKLDAIVGAGLEAYGIPTSAKVIVFAGRYSWEKNLPTLLGALQRVLSERRDTFALFFGEGPLGHLIADAGKKHENRMRVFGYTETLWEILKSADIFVSVSNFEGHPNTVLEAVALGCPVVLSDIPAHREILDDTMAYFASPRSEETIADRLIEALDQPGIARQKADLAKGRIRNLSAEHTAAQYARLYCLRQAQVRNDNGKVYGWKSKS
jgi:glycosyltransferase involved in cell wall biosynthesis